jgi:hypothetical protein
VPSDKNTKMSFLLLVAVIVGEVPPLQTTEENVAV